MPVSIRQRLQCICFSSCLLATLLLFLVSIPLSFAQSELATVFGRVTDSSGAVITGAEVEIRNVDTGIAIISATNSDGLYTIPSLHPGHYVISVRKPGFRSVSATGLELNVQDNVVRNFLLQVGSSSESITVSAEAGKINTTDASVSTVVDRQFAENLPMNGRSFQTLIQLTPGVVLTASTAYDGGQFSVNGQRANANYWMVDGVSANIGVGASVLGYPGSGAAGALPSFSAQGGTNSLVSVDAMQEFRIQTSTFAPEFGRTPGAQVSIVTRSGTNQYHGTLFNYIRNDLFDANDWFADRNGLAKPEERQNDFGGTLSGPVLKDRTFFFFSYEGLRLRLPRVSESTVPSLSARQNASVALQPYFNAFPKPDPNSPDTGGAPAPFDASYSDRSGLDAYSLRVDHRLKDHLTFFGRYNYSPSNLVQRASILNTVVATDINTQTTTVGSTWILSPEISNDARFNYSRTSVLSASHLDSFGGAVPLTTLPFPSPFSTNDALFQFQIRSLSGSLEPGLQVRNVQRQFNFVDGISIQKGSHSLKFGVDFRRLTPVYEPAAYLQDVAFRDVTAAETGSLFFSFIVNELKTPMLFRNLGVYAQDTWHMVPRLTLTYGLRWDVDFTPATTDGPPFTGAINFNDPATLALAPTGTPLFRTRYGNVAPRVGVAYQVFQDQNWQTVLRGGFGMFFDLATAAVGTNFNNTYPFGASRFDCCFNNTFPLDPATAAPPPITRDLSSSGTNNGLYAFNPELQLPYTSEWNVALEQGLAGRASLSASYLGAVGRRLIQSRLIESPNPNISFADLIDNTATSDYHALQVQFQQRFSRGLQALASYTWAHSIDTASADTYGNVSNLPVPGNPNRGPSDFDIRNAFSAGLTYNVPFPRANPIINEILGGWSIQNVIQARSASPVDVFDSNFFTVGNYAANVRPDVIPDIPFYLHGSQYPGNQAINPAAFAPPPTDANGVPLRQGTLGRNALRGFGATQWDFAVHRDFPITESWKLQFRAELFNVLNHPNFGLPVGDLANTGQFGQATKMLGQFLNGGTIGSNGGGGAFSPLYQIGGPRSIQFAMKLSF
jgi:hypothetical protein